MSEARRTRTRGGGRKSRLAARAHPSRTIVPYLTRKLPPYEVLGEEGLETIEQNAETILEETGIDFRDDAEALAIWKDAGATIDGQRVRFPRGLCRSLIQRSAPAEFVQHARNPARSVRIGGPHTVFVPAYGSPFIRNLDDGRRYATIDDFRNFVKLTYMTPALHHSGGTVCEPVDLPVNKRHLDMVYSHIRYSDKPFMGSVTTPERAEDSVALAKLVFGDEFVAQNVVTIGLVNANSPMTWDSTMLGALKVYARSGQATIVAPFVLAGAMSPVTVAGASAQILAEALAGMAFTQLLRPGAPVIFGAFASSISMQSGAPTFGTPEPQLVLYVTAALARRLGVPFRSGGALCASKIPDAQAAYESANSLQHAMLAGVNFMLHTAGWLEGGLTIGYEKFILDADQAGMLQVLADGVDMSVNGQAMDAIREVGPGAHFLGCAHTQANFETAFYRSNVADNNSFEQWESDGAPDAAKRANAIWKRMLDEYEVPDIDPGIDEALQDYIARRKAEQPDALY
jgi:trimethylamine--corrinoid protein Co-methyltransferase